jgi:predicted ATPase
VDVTSEIGVFTAREHDVVRLLSQGLSNEGISQDLGIALKTTEAAVRSIFMKLDLVQDRGWNRRVVTARWFIQRRVPHDEPLPLPTTALIGREAELRELEALLERARLITLTGPGGIGKTRLALELASRQADRRRTLFVDLATIDERSVRQRLFEAFGLFFAGDVGGMQLLARQLATEPHLIVIDNAEHVPSEVAALVTPLLATPATRLIVTSRNALNISGEAVWRVPPLAPRHSEALLIDRMVNAGGRETVDHSKVAIWCRALDGIPLALELAATRLTRLPSDTTAVDQHQLPEFLQADSVSRHGSLSGVIADSFQRLPSRARDLARAMSVFRGGFTSEMARSTVRDGHGDLALSHLVSSSLVEFNGHRYRMLEPIRQFIAGDLVPSQRIQAEDRLVTWATAFASDAGPGFLNDPQLWRPRIEAELDNIDVALDVAVERGMIDEALRLTRTVGPFWATGAASHTYRRIADLLDRRTSSSVDEGWAHLEAGRLALYTRNSVASKQHLERALGLFERRRNDDGVSVASFWLARLSGSAADLRNAAALAKSTGHAHMEGWAYLILARNTMRDLRDLPTALTWLENTERIARSHNLPQLFSDAKLLRAEVMLQANWLGGAEFPAAAIDALLIEVENFNETAGGAEQHTDFLSIATTASLHQRRWARARTLVRDQLDWSQRTEDPIVIAEAILMTAAVLADDRTPDAYRLAELAGPTFYEWSGPIWLAFTLFPANELFAAVRAAGTIRNASELIALADEATNALSATAKT